MVRETGRITQQQLRTAINRDQNNAGSRGEFKRFAGDGRLHMQVSIEAVMNAVNTEGPEVMEADGNGYWEDMKRMYPWTNTMPDKCVPRGMKCRRGRVKEKTIYHTNGTKTIIDENGARTVKR